MTDLAQELVEVELCDFPVPISGVAQEHGDGLMREFSLIAAGDASDAVPHRLLRLAERLEEQFGDYTTGYEQEVEAARARGDQTITVRLHVPPAARDAAVELGRMLAEADEYCRRGDLLSLVPPADVLRFRHWYLDQFVSQIDGEPPVSWTEYHDTAGAAS